MVRILMVVAQNGFRDEELFEPIEVFESNGYKVDIASVSKGEAKGMLGALINAELSIKDAKVYEYDAVAVVGGRGAYTLVENKELHRLLKDAHDRQKVVGAICLAPMILARAGLLGGKKATVYESQDSLRLFRETGVQHVKEDVVQSGIIVTASGPHAARKFGTKIKEMII